MVHEAGCVARAVNGGTCPANSFALINFHLSAFARLAQALVSVFVLLVAAYGAFAYALLIPAIKDHRAFHVLTPLVAEKEAMRWRAQKETSPTHIA